MTIFTGSQHDYDWLAYHGGYSVLHKVIHACPKILLGNFLAITAFDSGPLRLTDEEKSAGWWSDDKIAFSPQIDDIDSVPCDQFDEWLIFNGPPKELGDVEIFVNYGNFSIAALEQIHDPWEPTWDKSALDIDRELQEQFWSQLVRVAPESYLAEGDAFLFASQNSSLVDCVRIFLEREGVA